MTISTVAGMFGLKAQSLYRWYRWHLSDYESDTAQNRWPANRIMRVDESTGEVLTEQPLYVFKPENIGDQMCIDDKAIGHEGFTLMSNARTGKIALMIESTKCDEVQEALALFGGELEKVQSISCDMSPTYLKACGLKMPQAQRVIDKFHVMKYVYEAVYEVRMRIKKELTEQLSKGKKKTDEDKALLSDLEMLRRCRHLFSRSGDKWNRAGKELMYRLFEKYKDLERAYELGQDFKGWYQRTHPCGHPICIEKGLFDWYDKVEASNIKEFKGVVKMIVKHEKEIINYFETGHTNAKAERLNGKIQRFVSANYGLKQKDFNLYRIAGYFS